MTYISNFKATQISQSQTVKQTDSSNNEESKIENIDDSKGKNPTEDRILFQPDGIKGITAITTNLEVRISLPDTADKAKLRSLKDPTTIEKTLMESETTAGIKNFLEDGINNQIRSIPLDNRKTRYAVGVHLPNTSKLDPETKKRLERGEISIKDLTDEQKKEIVVNLQTEDIMPIGKSEDKRGWTPQFNPDGKVFPYTLLPKHAGTRVGIPYIVETKDKTLFGKVEQNIDPKSIKLILYKDPSTQEIKTGTYFEIAETSNDETKTNGVIVEEGNSIMLINKHSRNAKGGELFFIPSEEIEI